MKPGLGFRVLPIWFLNVFGCRLNVQASQPVHVTMAVSQRPAGPQRERERERGDKHIYVYIYLNTFAKKDRRHPP